MAIIKPRSGNSDAQHQRERTRDFSGLIEQLSDAQPTARRWAARDLAAHHEATPYLVERLGREVDPAAREAILVSLTQIGTPDAVHGLVECLGSEDVALRNEAIEAMKSLPAEVAPIMSGLLQNHDPDIRIFAVNILESLRHPNVEYWLIDVIENDQHLNVCATAVDLLGEVGSEFSIDALEALKKRYSNEPYIVFACSLALQRIRDGRTV